MKSKKKIERPKRSVLSIFYRGHEVVRTNHSVHPNNAVVNAIKHMQTNQYDARLVEVFCSVTGALYAVIKWAKAGTELQIAYKADIIDFNPSKERP